LSFFCAADKDAKNEKFPHPYPFIFPPQVSYYLIELGGGSVGAVGAVSKIGQLPLLKLFRPLRCGVSVSEVKMNAYAAAANLSHPNTVHVHLGPGAKSMEKETLPNGTNERTNVFCFCCSFCLPFVCYPIVATCPPACPLAVEVPCGVFLQRSYLGANCARH